MMGLERYNIFCLLFLNSLLYIACTTEREEVDMDLHPFVKVGSKYYLVQEDSDMNWFAAAHFCRSYDSDLLTIESKAEKDALFTHLKEIFNSVRAWTSINDLSEEGKHMSLSTGRPMLYTFWGANEPNNVGDSEDCMEVMYHNNTLIMNDNSCDRKMLVICEKRLPLKTRNSATEAESYCEKLSSCDLKKLVNVYLQTAKVNNYRE